MALSPKGLSIKNADEAPREIKHKLRDLMFQKAHGGEVQNIFP